MNRRLMHTLILSLVLSTVIPGTARADRPEWLDRLLWNAEERTRRGSDSLEAQDYSQAAASMDTALRLAPEDATAQFNAGTARLPVDPEEGRRLLEAAGSGESADPQLVSRAHYNAGHSYLESGELESAVESFKNALRKDPDFEDAKFNLELAQKRLEEQQQNQENQDQQDQQDQENQDQQDQENQDPQDQQDQDSQDQENQDPQDQENQDPQDQENQDQQDQDSQDQENQDQENQDQQDQEGGQGEQDEQDEQEGPLPQFQDLPDMTAEEAAAILEAIENMEREQRRQEALEAAKTNVGRKKDW